MKLGELKSAIRKTKGSPTVALPFGDVVMNFQLLKAPLLEELDRHFPGGKGVETGISFDEGTNIMTPGPNQALSKLIARVDADDDLLTDTDDDLLTDTDDDLLV